MTEIAELWAWRNGMPARDYPLHLIDCRHNDTMAMIRGMDLTEQTIRALAQPFEFRTAGAREVDIMRRLDWARTQASIEAMRW